jgi:hypothetical protein
MRRTQRLLTIVALVAFAAACGSDDGDELSKEEQAYADAFAEDFADADDGIGVDADEADCMASAIMQEIGTEPFEDADVTTKDLSGDETTGQLLGDGAITTEQAESIYAAWEDCADIPAAFASGAEAQFDADAEGVACIEDGLRDGDALRDYMVESFTSGDEPDPTSPGLSGIIALVMDCTGEGEDGAGGAFVDSIAESLAEDGSITQVQARCMAQSIVDTVGVQALLEGGAGGDFESASPELQQQIVTAITGAAGACDVPLSQLGGG